jgi:tmRNA-binding protein
LATGGKSEDGLMIVQDLKIELKRGKMKLKLNLKKGKQHETIRNTIKNIWVRPVDGKFDRLRQRSR